jgi:plastocyanin domain-containing protein
VMLAFGSFTSLVSGRFAKWMTVAAAVIVIVMGGVFINRGAVLLGSPVSFESAIAAVTGSSAGPASGVAFAQDANGVTEVKIAIQNGQFVPSTVTIPADRPVRLVVDRQEANACSDQIAIPQLGVLQNLAPNATTSVDLPATKGGTYRLTCGMGMMSGTLAAVAASGAEQAAVPAVAAQTPVSPAQSAPAAQAPAQAAAGGDCCCGSGTQAPPSAAEPKSAKVAGDVQRISVDVSKGYYDPASIVLKAGVPAEITFSQSTGCTGQVVSEDLGFSADLTAGPYTVKIPAQRAGRYGFHCGMNMVSGTITVQ